MQKEFLSGSWTKVDLGEGITCMVWVVSKKSETDVVRRRRAMAILKRRLTKRRADKCLFDGKSAKFHICKACADELC